MLRCRLRASPTSCARATSSSAISNACSACRRPDHSHSNEGFFADPAVGAEMLTGAGIGVVGIANNVHYGEAINGSIAQLDRIGVLHTGAGKNLAAARAPVIVERARRAFRFPAAQLGVLADQSRSAQGRRRHRRDQGAHRLSNPDVAAEAGFLSAQPSRHSAGDHHLGGRRLSRRVQGGHRRAPSAGRRAGGVMPLGPRPRGPAIHDRDCARRDRRRRRHRGRAWAALCACRSRSTRASRSSTASAICRSTPAIAACMATGSGMLVRVALEQGKVAGATFRSCATTTRTRRSSPLGKTKRRRWPRSSPAARRFGTKLKPNGDQVEIALGR